MPWNFVMRPSATIETNHASARTIVKRFRLRSANPEEPRADVMPPPNMSERPPPRPLCSRMSRVSRRLVMPRSTCRTNSRMSTVVQAFRGDHPPIAQGSSIRADSHRPDASHSDVLLEPHDGRELVHDEARAAHKGAVDVGLPHEARDVGRLDRTAVQHAGAG